jgi:hypothetical protein
VKTSLLIVISAIVIGVGGYVWGVKVEAARGRHALAEETYSWLCYPRLRYSHDKRQLSIWREELGNELEADLRRKAEIAAWVSDDSIWGPAFEVMRSPDEQQWQYHEGMTPQAQDEMIRYLCFRLRRLEGDPDRQLEALRAYPTAALTRNRQNIEWTIQTLHQFGSPRAWYLVSELMPYLAADEWGKELCLNHLKKSVAHGSEYPWDMLWQVLYSFARGEGNWVPHPAKASQVGAAQVLKAFAHDMRNKQGVTYDVAREKVGLVDQWLDFIGELKVPTTNPGP